jgi:hypothetical protein
MNTWGCLFIGLLDENIPTLVNVAHLKYIHSQNFDVLHLWAQGITDSLIHGAEL